MSGGYVPDEEVTDQPQEEVETEGEPEEAIAAPELDSGAAVDPEPQYITREEFDRARQQAREEAERDAVERLRRETQRKNALAARERTQQDEARAQALREARLALHDQGIGDVEPERVTPAFDSYVKTYRATYERAVEADATDGFVIAAAKVLGASIPSDLDPSDRAYTYAEGVESYVKGLYDRAYEKAKSDLQNEYVPKSDLPKLIDGAVKKHLKSQKGGEDFKAPDGTPAPAAGDLTVEAYAGMSPADQRRLQREHPELINAMTARIPVPAR